MLLKRFIIFTSLLLTSSWVEKTDSLNIECWFNEAAYWTAFDKPYACVVHNFQGAENVQENITSVTGETRDGLTYSDVKVFDIRGFCNFIPTGIDKYFDNIEGFSAFNTTLLTVTSDDMKQFPKLRELWIYFNLLQFLPSNLFEHNPNIENIYFHNNKIKFFGADFFTHIPKLAITNFVNNECISRDAKNEKLFLLKREIKKKCSSETGPTEISHDIKSLQLDYLYLKKVSLQKKVLKLKESNKKKC